MRDTSLGTILLSLAFALSPATASGHGMGGHHGGFGGGFGSFGGVRPGAFWTARTPGFSNFGSPMIPGAGFAGRSSFLPGWPPASLPSAGSGLSPWPTLGTSARGGFMPPDEEKIIQGESGIEGQVRALENTPGTPGVGSAAGQGSVPGASREGWQPL